MNKYKNGHVKGQAKIYRAINKYGFSAFDVEYIFSTEKEYKHLGVLLSCLERFFIKKYDCVISGYNLMSGGMSSRHTEQSKKKLSENHKGLFAGEKHYLYGKQLPEETKQKLRRKRTPEQVERNRQAQLGKTMSDEFKKRMSEIHTGRKRPQSTKDGISKALKGRPKSKEHILAMSLAVGHRITQHTKDGEYIRDWNSLKEAGATLHISPEYIGKTCKGIIDNAGGFIWKYKNIM